MEIYHLSWCHSWMCIHCDLSSWLIKVHLNLLLPWFKLSLDERAASFDSWKFQVGNFRQYVCIKLSIVRLRFLQSKNGFPFLNSNNFLVKKPLVLWFSKIPFCCRVNSTAQICLKEVFTDLQLDSMSYLSDTCNWCVKSPKTFLNINEAA